MGDTAHGHRAAGVTAHAHCAGAGDRGGSGHVPHADPACASAALDGPTVPPALTPSPLGPVRPRTRPARAGRTTPLPGPPLRRAPRPRPVRTTPLTWRSPRA
ncbi:DUF6153 family protein [Streptomyces lydicus]|uniref:DUF6153 family protein n=1 Tax=Streptomyces lydicus TaxID=47763 RepID=UPI003D767DC5